MGERIRRVSGGKKSSGVRTASPTSSVLHTSKESKLDLTHHYPTLNAWVFGGGWVEIGHNYGASMACALDEGGQIWEGKRKYGSLEEVLKAHDQGIADWLRKNG